MSEITRLSHGERVRFELPDTERGWWWSVRAGDERFTILTRQAPFKPKGQMLYTIIDRFRGVRGPSNLIGQGWDSEMSDTACTKLLEALASGMVAVSYRNYLPVAIREVRQA